MEESEPVVMLKTVAGRSIQVPYKAASYWELVRCAVSKLNLDQSTLKLLHKGIHLVPPEGASIDDSSEECLAAMGIPPGAEIVAIGVRSSVMTPSPHGKSVSSAVTSPLHRSSSPSLTPVGPLSEPHVPDGLRSFTEGMNNATSIDAKYNFAADHATMAAIANIVKANPSALDGILRQANEVFPPFTECVRENSQLFLDFLNGSTEEFFEVEMFGEVDAERIRQLHVIHATLQEKDELEGGAEANSEDNQAFSISDGVVNKQYIATLERELHEAAASQNLLGVVSACHRLATDLPMLDGPKPPDIAAVISHYHLETCTKSLEMALATIESRDSTYEVPVALSFSPMIFADALSSSLQMGDVRNAFVTALCHQTFVEMLRTVTPEYTAPAQQVELIVEHCQKENSTVVVFEGRETVDGEQLTDIFVVSRDGNVAHASVSPPLSLRCVESAVRLVQRAFRNSATNASMVWQERMAELFEWLIQPIVELLPSPPAELMCEAAAVEFILPWMFVSSIIPIPALLNRDAVPVCARWSVSQFFSVKHFLSALQQEEPKEAHTVVLSEQCSSWLTRSLRRMLHVVGDATVTSEVSIVHSDTDSTSRRAALHFCECYQPFRGVKAVHKIHRTMVFRAVDVPGAVPYELLRNFYTSVARGVSVTSSLRLAMLACNTVHVDKPWLWGSFCVVGYGGPMTILAQAALRAPPTFEADRNVRRVRATQEFQYLETHGVGFLFEQMLQELLRSRPQGESEVHGTVLRFLQENESALSLSCQRTVAWFRALAVGHGPSAARMLRQQEAPVATDHPAEDG